MRVRSVLSSWVAVTLIVLQGCDGGTATDQSRDVTRCREHLKLAFPEVLLAVNKSEQKPTGMEEILTSIVQQKGEQFLMCPAGEQIILNPDVKAWSGENAVDKLEIAIVCARAHTRKAGAPVFQAIRFNGLLTEVAELPSWVIRDQSK